LRVRDGHELTLTTRARNAAGDVGLLDAVDGANPLGDLSRITDNLASHTSPPVVAWLEDHPRVHQAFLPKAACWLNPQEGRWRLFRRAAFAGQTCADAEEIDRVAALATTKLDHRAKPGVWGRPPRRHRHPRRRFVYRL
jgi:hypothetical protein